MYQTVWITITETLNLSKQEVVRVKKWINNWKYSQTQNKASAQTSDEKSGENLREKDPEVVDDEEEDISKALNKEVAELKAESEKPAGQRRFQVSIFMFHQMRIE